MKKLSKLGIAVALSLSLVNVSYGTPVSYTVNTVNVGEIEDSTHGMRRVEVVCARCEGHLGHVFEDIILCCFLLNQDNWANIIGLDEKPSFNSHIVIQGIKVDLSTLDTEQNQIYYLPSATGIDLYFAIEGKKIYIQATSMQKAGKEKVEKFLAKVPKGENSVAWFISLLETSSTAYIEDERLVITAGEEASPLLGQDVYQRLLEIKQKIL